MFFKTAFFQIFFFLVIIFTTNCFAQTQLPKLSFKHISTEQGLSNSTIECIYQDSKGFIWFGTRDGLNRYDGYQMAVYRYNGRDTNTISDNYIRFIYEDKNKTLWIATINGLNEFNRKENKFKRYKHDINNANSISNNLVTGIHEDSKGNFWVSTYEGLNLLNRNNKNFIQFHHNPNQSTTISDDRVNYIYEDAENNLWLATESGLNLYNPDTKTFSAFIIPGDNNNIRANNVIRVIEGDNKGNLWLGTEDNGLFLFNRRAKTFTHYTHVEKESQSLASNLVRTILMDKEGNTWIGGINGGLDLYNPLSNSFFHYQNEPEKMFSLSQRTVSALYEDNQQNLWVGTHRGGVNLYTPKREKFTLYQQEPEENSLSYNDVKTFCEDSKGNIWIGTDGGGLNMFDRNKNSFTHYKYNPYNITSIGSNEVIHVMEDSEGNLWAGTWGGGLNLLNRSTGKFTRFVNNPADKSSISSNYIQKIFEDYNKNLWIATYYGGLNLFDRKAKKFSRIVDDPEHKTTLSGNNIVSINEDGNSNIWIGTDDGGLNCYNTTEKKFYHYFNKEEKLPDLRIIFTDSKGRLWIGQAGLYLFDAKQKTFSLYTDKAGLSDEFVKGIEEDKEGNFWLATSNGVTKFDPETFQFKKYNTADGLQGLEFEANAYYKTRDGEIYFGGVNGFNKFYPENININKYVPPVYLTDFQIFNQKILPGSKDSPLNSDISETDRIILSYKQATFSFAFTALNYTASENNKYAYKLEGLNKDWNYAGNERKASYTNLDPGTYTFRVKAANNDGIWNEKGRAVTIIITPPFWNTWWFRLLVAIAIVSGLIALYKFNRKLELRKLEETKREEMHNLQLQFFTNISHEFRTPLSLIIGPVEKLEKEDPNSAFTHLYKTIHRNANRLMGLINELMDFRKAESGFLKLNVMQGNINLFLKEVSREFSEMAIEKKINFQVTVPSFLNETWFDRQVLEKIIINLLSNSFKYTSNGGTVSISAMESLEDFRSSFSNELILKSGYAAKKYVYFHVADNGIGISKESIAHLFERYYKISDTHLGSGIGLAFVKSLTFLHKGNIYVYSERNKGTEIIIAIPVSKEDYNRKERWICDKKHTVKLESIETKYEYDQQLINGNYVTEEKLSTPGVKQHILIVDDNEELRNFLIESFGDYYTVTAAENGNIGFLKAKEEVPDLIISDVMMPDTNGIEFCKMIKEDIETSHIPFLMLTAKDALDARLEGMESGADYYFAKHLSIDLLLLTVRNILNQKLKLKERYTKDYHAEAKDLVHSAKDKQFIDELLQVIESQLSNPDMDVDYICNKIGMSRTKLYQKIKGITGQSISDFVRTIRLKKAVQIMTHEDSSITDVMYSVGIQTQSYFTKAFKKEFGKTPSQFLQELKK